MNHILPKSFWYDTLDSTMDEAKRLIKSGKIQDTAYIVSDYQTAGRGRHGKVWDSPRNAGIYLSIVHLPQEGRCFRSTPFYTFACGVACVETLKEICKIEALIKPINDIYVGSKKLGGILIESKLHKDGISELITGVGINVCKVIHALDKEKAYPISIEEILLPEDFKKFSRNAFIEKLVYEINYWYSFLFNGEDPKVKDVWEKYKIKN